MNKFLTVVYANKKARRNFAALVTADRGEDVVLEARRYINLRNARSSADPVRQDMSLAARMPLFAAEAVAAHKVKGHCELLEAYMWHRTSIDRQRDNTTHVLQQLKGYRSILPFRLQRECPVSNVQGRDRPWGGPVSHARLRQHGCLCPTSMQNSETTSCRQAQ